MFSRDNANTYTGYTYAIISILCVAGKYSEQNYRIRTQVMDI